MRNFDIEEVARVIEEDMGEQLPDIRQALNEAKAETVGRVATPSQIQSHQELEASPAIRPSLP